MSAAVIRGSKEADLAGPGVGDYTEQRRHELTSMGIRVNAETLRRQLEMTGQLDWLGWPKVLKEICAERNIHVIE
jgi:hypothetical protein